MTHFAVFSPGLIGHLNPMCALGRELQRRDHKVTFFHIPDLEARIKKSGLDFYPIGHSEFPIGSSEAFSKKLGKMSGKSGRKLTMDWVARETTMFFREAELALKDNGVEMLLVDHASKAGGTIAEKLNLPFITIYNALITNREAGVPPYFTNWTYNQAWWAKLRNQVGNYIADRTSSSTWKIIQQQRINWNLPLHINRDDSHSKLAQICQLPKEFDFPRVNLPSCFHYTGPLQDPSGSEPLSFPDIPFPWEKLKAEKPLIYASLGTLQNKKPEIFQIIAEACKDLDAQLVISLGNPNNKPSDYNLPDTAIVVAYAPHQKLIARSSLVITHAGMNTTLGALSSGVPMVAIPITNEQPGIAARIKWTGAGQIITLRNLTTSKLRDAVQLVLKDISFKNNALNLQKAIQEAGGIKKAANIIEEAISTSIPSFT